MNPPLPSKKQCADSSSVWARASPPLARAFNLPGQTVYSKALTLYVALSLLLGTAVVLLTSQIILREFLETERLEMVSTLQRFTGVLGRETRPLEISLDDWIERNSSSKTEQILNPTSAGLAALQIDFLSLVDRNGNAIGEAFVDEKARKQFQMDSSWTTWLNKFPPTEKGTASSGFILMGDNLTALVCNDVGHGQKIAAGRIFDGNSFIFLEGLFGARVKFEPLRGLKVMSNSNDPLLTMLAKNEFVVEAKAPNELVGHSLIRGINGHPIGQFNLTQGRPLYHAGLQAVQVFLTVLTLAGGTLFLIVWVLLDRTILARIRDLTRRVEAEKDWTNLPLKLEFRGDDELALLARRIEELAGELDRAQWSYRSVVEDQTEVICRFNASYAITFSNGVFQKLFPHDHVKGTFLQGCLPPAMLESLTKKMRELTPKQPVGVFLQQVPTSAGSASGAWLRCTLRANFQADGRNVGGQWVATDITPQIQAQQRVKDSERRLRSLSSQLMRLQDDERRKIARELHDSTAQSLSALEMNMSLLEPLASDENTKRIVAETRQIARDCCLELRTISYLLHPPLLDEVGLLFAIQWFADGFTKRSSIDVTLDLMQNFPRLDSEIETTLFRILQEAMTNIYRHSGASRAWITLNIQEGLLFLEIRDNGSGLKPSASESAAFEGVGFAGMRERLVQFHGRLDVASSPYGLSVSVRLNPHIASPDQKKQRDEISPCHPQT